MCVCVHVCVYMCVCVYVCMCVCVYVCVYTCKYIRVSAQYEHKLNTNWTQVNISEHKLNTSEHKWTQTEHKWTQVNTRIMHTPLIITTVYKAIYLIYEKTYEIKYENCHHLSHIVYINISQLWQCLPVMTMLHSYDNVTMLWQCLPA